MSTTSDPTTTTLTIGMQLDAMLEKLDSLSSTQLYGIIVLATVGVSFLLLGSGGNSYTTVDDADVAFASKTTTATATTTRHNSTTTPLKGQQQRQEPKWHILKWLNYAAIVGFVASVAKAAMHASGYYTALLPGDFSLVQYLVGWSLFLCYFFGFFGISFIGAEELAAMADANDNSSTNDNKNRTTTTSVATRSQERAAASTPATTSTSSVASVSMMSSSNKKLSSSCSNKKPTTTTTTTFHSPPPASAASACAVTTHLCSSKSLTTTTSSSSSTLEHMKDMTNEQICSLVLENKVKDHELEKRLDPHRAVTCRRLVMNAKLGGGKGTTLDGLPYQPSLDYAQVYGANCEIVVGYVPLPVGMVGPLLLNGETVYIPMATTEGCLVASTNRGVKAISQSQSSSRNGGGAHSFILRDGITRAPCVRMTSAKEAAALKLWCQEPSNFASLQRAFESTTSFGKLTSCVATVAGRNVYLRLECFSGDAMGMNMVSKGSLAVIEVLQEEFPSLQLVALSGNMCTDKKAAATNWIEGRGKSVVVEATIPEQTVRKTLKTTVKAICETNLHKNLVGSAMAGTIGGFNAHASNIVTAIFLATGQDPAQNVESSNCITLMEETTDGDLWISCTMPSIEVGTVGGGTSLPAQSACLEAIGCRGGCKENPGENARQLAMVVAAATMAGELSLLAALAANTLVQAHMTHNRKTTK